MTIIQGLLIFFTIIFLYFIIVYYLHKKEILKKYNISLYGPALLLRTKKGIKFLEKISTLKRFWKGFGSLGIVLCFIFMVLMVWLLVWQAWTIWGFTPEQRQAIPGVEIALVLPGINPILPLEYIGYILLALVLAIIVHEFSHGILTLIGKLKVKSLGILYLIVPIGAFCEPDEEALKKTEPLKRMRVYAAGPMSNLVVTLISILIFSFVFMASVQPAVNGIQVFEVVKDTPAEYANIQQTSIITSINGTDLTQYYNYNERYEVYINLLNNTVANETINITFYNDVNGPPITKNLTLVDRAKYFEGEGVEGKGFTGIFSTTPVETHLSYLKNPFTEKFPLSFLFVYILPMFNLEGYNPITSPFTNSYVITGPLSVLPTEVFWVFVNALYWIFWLNLAVGLFNVLPMVPLDGGFIFNDAVGETVKKLKKNITPEKKDKIVKNVSLIISLLILFAIIFPFIMKYI